MAAPVMATPAMIAATPTLPTTSTLLVSTERIAYCETCLALGRPCPLFAPPAPTVSPPHLDWSNFEVEEDWDREGKKTKRKRRIENVMRKNLKDKNYFPPSPMYMPNAPSNTDDTLTPELTNTLVLTSEERQK